MSGSNSGCESPVLADLGSLDPQRQQGISTTTKPILVDKSGPTKQSTSSTEASVETPEQKRLQENDRSHESANRISFLQVLAASEDQRPSVSQGTAASQSCSKEVQPELPDTTALESPLLDKRPEDTVKTKLPERPHSAPARHWCKDQDKAQWFFVASPRRKTAEPGQVEVRTYCLKSPQAGPDSAHCLDSQKVDTFVNSSSSKLCSLIPKRSHCYSGSSFKLLSDSHTNRGSSSYTAHCTLPTSTTTTAASAPPSLSTLKSATTTMSGNLQGMQCLGRLHEKQELQELNDRLSHYIKHVQELRQSGSADSSSFFESIQMLENELISLKAMYQKELDSAR